MTTKAERGDTIHLPHTAPATNEDGKRVWLNSTPDYIVVMIAQNGAMVIGLEGVRYTIDPDAVVAAERVEL
jgi:hypothetical protein